MLEDYVVIDLEMTGLNAKTDAILEVGAVRVRDGRQTETYGAILKCGRELSERVVELTGITPEMAADGREPEEVMQEFFTFLGDDVLVGQNVIFDYSFLKRSAVNHGLPFVHQGIDTLKLARNFLPDAESRRLEDLCTYYHIETAHHHRAVDDAIAAKCLYDCLRGQFLEGHEAYFAPGELIYEVKRENPATAAQKRYLNDLIKYHKIAIDYAVDQLTKNEASRKIDQILLTYGRIR